MIDTKSEQFTAEEVSDLEERLIAENVTYDAYIDMHGDEDVSDLDADRAERHWLAQRETLKDWLYAHSDRILAALRKSGRGDALNEALRGMGIPTNPGEAALQALADQAQELGMGYEGIDIDAVHKVK